MKPQIALSPEQMHKLKSLGLDCSDASMVCINFNGTYAYVGGEEAEAVMDCINGKFYVEFSPAYTLEDILMKLREFSPQYKISPNNWSHTFYKIELPYEEAEDFSKVYFIKMDDSLASAFEALKWVLQNHPDKIKRI